MKKTLQATRAYHMLVAAGSCDKKQFDSVQDIQIKVIYIEVKNG